DFDTGKRLADGVGTKRLEVVHRDCGAGLGEAVTICDGNAQFVEELQCLRFAESAADDDDAQLASEGPMHLLEQCTAQGQTRATFCERRIYGSESLEDFAFGRRQGIEARLQTLLEIFEDERNETYIGDFIFGERFAHVFRAKSAQMNHCCPAD